MLEGGARIARVARFAALLLCLREARAYTIPACMAVRYKAVAAGPNDPLWALASCLFASLTIASRLCIRCLHGGTARRHYPYVWGQLHAGRTWATEHARNF